MDRFYRNVPREQVERLREFRATHPLNHVQAGETSWEYIACGEGDRPLLLLTGGLARADTAFSTILKLEKDYRLVVPSYPSVATMGELAEGIVQILDREGFDKISVMGGSYGGAVAQCFLYQQPHRVKKLILSHTIAPAPDRVKVAGRALRVIEWLPMGALRFLLRLQFKRLIDPPLRAANHPARPLWHAMINEATTESLTRESLLNSMRRVVDFYEHYPPTPDALKGWTGKILILESDNDPAAPPHVRARLKALYPEARVHTFHGTGHVSSILEPEEYYGAVRRFLGAA